ncbi:MAG: polyphosphate kinase 2 family protein [Paludibacter sp.]|nr:polyphosphate kinase 2 family protein [Paludibacter sp.]
MSKNDKLDVDDYRVKEGTKFSLKDYPTEIKRKEIDKEEGEFLLRKDVEELSALQDVLYADKQHAVLIIIQAMDAAGKDGTIKHIMSGVNPEGVQVTSFKTPSSTELDHDFFWRHYIVLPGKGEIGIFNRSHYENVLITKVHPEFILNEKHAGIKSVEDINKSFWQKRYKQICRFEKNLTENDTTILKFFLHVSKDEQKKRFLDRIDDPTKNWKFSAADLKERAFWDTYQLAYEDAIENTSTKEAPWFVIPADEKWYSRYIVGKIICNELEKLNLSYPKISESERVALLKAKETLLSEV